MLLSWGLFLGVSDRDMHTYGLLEVILRSLAGADSSSPHSCHCSVWMCRPGGAVLPECLWAADIGLRLHWWCGLRKKKKKHNQESENN